MFLKISCNSKLAILFFKSHHWDQNSQSRREFQFLKVNSKPKLNKLAIALQLRTLTKWESIGKQVNKDRLQQYIMQQSATDSRKARLNTRLFLEKATITPALSWEKWIQQRKLALLSKRGNTTRNPPQRTTSKSHIPVQTCVRGTRENHKQATEHDKDSQSATNGDEAKLMHQDRWNWHSIRQKTLGNLRSKNHFTSISLQLNSRPHDLQKQSPTIYLWKRNDEKTLACLWGIVHKNS